jgi:hypothetical protein
MIIYLKSNMIEFKFFLNHTYLVPTIGSNVDRWALPSGNSHMNPKSAIFGLKLLSSKMFFNLMF